MIEHTVILLAGIALMGIACQWFAWWVKLPAILFLLLAGIVAGPVTGILHPDALFGDLLFPMISLAVAIILFEGSLTLKFSEIRGLTRVVRNMVTIGMLVTWVVTAVSVHYLLDFAWEMAFLFGAVVVVTGPTVIVPMLRTVRPKASIANILRWEGIVIDPIGALLAVLVFEFIISGRSGNALGHTFLVFGQVILVGMSTGALGGYVLGLLLRNHLLPEYLRNMATLSLLFGVFACSNALQHESGLLAVTVMGMWLANMRGVRVHEILNFKENLSILLISGLFIILAARIEFEQIAELGWAALLVLLSLQFIARPLKVLVSCWGSSLSLNERLMLAWIAPRGIVAAAVSALFALRLQQDGYPQSEYLVPMTFLVIIWTVVTQSATARMVAKLLNVAEPEPRGVLIIGANSVARTLAKGLIQRGFRALLIDTNWENIRTARMDGLNTFYGNPVSEHADRNLDLIGIGRMLALSPQRDLNVLAGLRYRAEFGTEHIYTLQTAQDKDVSEKHRIAEEHRGHTLFGEEVSYAMLASQIKQGAEVRTTQLTDNYSFDNFREQHGKRAIPLFAIDPKEKLHIFVAGGKLHPQSGWTLISLMREDPELARSKAAS